MSRAWICPDTESLFHFEVWISWILHCSLESGSCFPNAWISAAFSFALHRQLGNKQLSFCPQRLSTAWQNYTLPNKLPGVLKYYVEWYFFHYLRLASLNRLVFYIWPLNVEPTYNLKANYSTKESMLRWLYFRESLRTTNMANSMSVHSFIPLLSDTNPHGKWK